MSLGFLALARSRRRSTDFRLDWTRRLGVVALWLGAGVAFVAVPWIPSVCPMRLVLRVPCPSCGFTRAARFLLHGDLAAATQIHPLWWLVFPFLAIVAAMEAWGYVTTGAAGRWSKDQRVQSVGAALLGALILVWAARGLGFLGGPAPIE